MLCENCGQSLPDNSRFCSGCGYMLLPEQDEINRLADDIQEEKNSGLMEIRKEIGNFRNELRSEIPEEPEEKPEEEEIEPSASIDVKSVFSEEPPVVISSEGERFEDLVSDLFSESSPEDNSEDREYFNPYNTSADMPVIGGIGTESLEEETTKVPEEPPVEIPEKTDEEKPFEIPAPAAGGTTKLTDEARTHIAQYQVPPPEKKKPNARKRAVLMVLFVLLLILVVLELVGCIATVFFPGSPVSLFFNNVMSNFLFFTL